MPVKTATKAFCTSIPHATPPASSSSAADQQQQQQQQQLFKKPLTTNCYLLLGVKMSATPDELRAAFKRESLRCHPDRVMHLPEADRKNAETLFKLVNAANERLKDPKTRSEYDAELRRHKRLKQFKSPPAFQEGAALAPVNARLCNGEVYAFETAPTRLKGRFRHLDSVRWPDGRTGVIVGLAADGNLYWREDGCDFVTLFQPFGDARDIDIVYRMPTAASAASPVTSSSSSSGSSYAHRPSSASSSFRRPSQAAGGGGAAAAGPSSAAANNNSNSSTTPRRAKAATFSSTTGSGSPSAAAPHPGSSCASSMGAFPSSPLHSAADFAERAKAAAAPHDPASVHAGLSRALLRNIMELQRDENAMRETLRIKTYQELLSIHRRVRSMMVASATQIEERAFFEAAAAAAAESSNLSASSSGSARGGGGGPATPRRMKRANSFSATASSSVATPPSPSNSLNASLRANNSNANTRPTKVAYRPPTTSSSASAVSAAASAAPRATRSPSASARAAAAAARRGSIADQHSPRTMAAARQFIDPWCTNLRGQSSSLSPSPAQSTSPVSTPRTSAGKSSNKSPPTEPADCNLGGAPPAPIASAAAVNASSSSTTSSFAYASNKVATNHNVNAGEQQQQQQQQQKAEDEQSVRRSKQTTTPFARNAPPPSVAAAAAALRVGIRRGQSPARARPVSMAATVSSPLVRSTSACTAKRANEILQKCEVWKEQPQQSQREELTFGLPVKADPFFASVDIATNRSCTPAPILRRGKK